MTYEDSRNNINFNQQVLTLTSRAEQEKKKGHEREGGLQKVIEDERAVFRSVDMGR